MPRLELVIRDVWGSLDPEVLQSPFTGEQGLPTSRFVRAIFSEIFPRERLRAPDTRRVKSRSLWDQNVSEQGADEIRGHITSARQTLARFAVLFFELEDLAGDPAVDVPGPGESRRFKMAWRAAALESAGMDLAPDVILQLLEDQEEGETATVAAMWPCIEDPEMARYLSSRIVDQWDDAEAAPETWVSARTSVLATASSGAGLRAEQLHGVDLRCAVGDLELVELAAMQERPELGGRPVRTPLPRPLDRTVVERVHGFLKSGANRQRVQGGIMTHLERAADVAVQPLGLGSPQSRVHLLEAWANVYRLDVLEPIPDSIPANPIAQCLWTGARPYRAALQMGSGEQGSNRGYALDHGTVDAAARDWAIRRDRLAEMARDFAPDVMSKWWVRLHNADLVGDMGVEGGLNYQLQNIARRVAQDYTSRLRQKPRHRQVAVDPQEQLRTARLCIAALDDAAAFHEKCDEGRPESLAVARQMWDAAMNQVGIEHLDVTRMEFKAMRVWMNRSAGNG